MEEKETR